MKSKKSMLRSILHVNLTMVLLLTILFVSTSGLYARQLAGERYNLANTTLAKLNKDFQLEMQRLNSLLTLCIEDPSIVYTLSDKLDPAFFLDNAQEASAKLTLMYQSLPYAKTVFLYTRTTQRVVRDNGSLFDEDNFIKLVLNKSDDTSLTNIRDLPDGLYQYSPSRALYVKNLYRHGYIAVQIDLTNFANINKTLGSNFLGYVIQEDGRCLICNAKLPLSEEQIAQILKKDSDFITIEDTKYYCVSAEMNLYPYTGVVLINNDSLMYPLHYMYMVMGIAFVILCASLLLLILLNLKVYMPLKRFTSQFNNSNDNEISIIENQIHELLLEINSLNQNTEVTERIPERIALYYLLSGGAQLDEDILASLEEKYPYYMTLALALQKQSGADDISFAALLEKELTSRFSLKFISMNKHDFVLVAKPEDKEAILSDLESLLEEADPSTQLFVGIREYCTDIKELHTEYKLASNCLSASLVTAGKRFCFCENAKPPRRTYLGLEKHNRLFEYARNNAPDSLIQELEQIFYPAQGLSLADFHNYYEEVLSVFEKACAAKKISPPSLSDSTFAYNTDYMYQTLCTLAKQLFRSAGEYPADMKMRMEEYISQHLSEPLTLDTVADAFSISPVYLSSWFKKNMNINFLTYVSTARMEHAIRLLCQPNPPRIYEVATAVGIDNTTTFIRQFKKHTGVTPSQYQKNVVDTV